MDLTEVKHTQCTQWNLRNPTGMSLDPILGQEDCLLLNVFIPQNIWENKWKMSFLN